MGGTRRVTGPLPRVTEPAHGRHEQAGHRAHVPAQRDPAQQDPAQRVPAQRDPALVPAQRTGRHDAVTPPIERSENRRVVVTPRAPGRDVVPPTLVMAALGALVGACVFALVGRALVDDAYLLLAYARTLGLHGGWGVYPGLTANTATSPLAVLVVGGITTLTRDAFAATGVALALTFAAAGAGLTRIGTRLGMPAYRAPLFGLAFLATSPLMLSTIGLESSLALALVVGLTERTLARGRWSAGVLAGLLVLTRPDLAVVALVAVVVAGRGWWKVTLTAAATALPWFAWSWWTLGSTLPDTALLGPGARWDGWGYSSGPALWWATYPVATALVAVPVIAGLVALPFWLRRGDLRPAGAVLGLGALAHAAVLGVLAAAPDHAQYVPAAGGLGLLAALGCARARRPAARAAATAVAAALAVTCVLNAAGAVPPPLTSDAASVAQYRRIADRIPTGATVRSPGEAGALAYYCDCRVLDATADRGALSPLIEARVATATGPSGWLLRLDHRHFRPVAPVPTEYRISTQVVRDPAAPMGTRWGPWRTWSLDPVPPGS